MGGPSFLRRAHVPLVALALVTLAAGLPARAQMAEPPNIVVVMVDDAEREEVEAMPNITSLIADQGMTFERFYTPQPLCCPSRSTFLLGEYPHNHGVIANSGKRGGFLYFRRRGHEGRTIARTLREAGYATGLFGKYLNGYGSDGPRRHVPRYWNRWLATRTTSYYDYSLVSNGRIRHYGKKRRHYQTTVLDAQSRGWMRVRSSKGPFFAFVSMRAPHSDFTSPPSHKRDYARELSPSRMKPSFNELDVSDKPRAIRRLPRLKGKEIRRIDRQYRTRMRMLRAVDDHVARLVRDLTNRGEIANTYIFVTSDNGWMKGEHRLPKGKSYPYEESAHMPLIVRGPGIAPGSTSSALVSMTDLFATFAEIAQRPTPRDGRSLLPLLEGTATDWRDQLLLEGFKGRRFRAVVTDRYKYVRWASGERELYDLVADPHEAQSLHATAPRPLVDGLDALIDPLATCAGDGCRIADGGP